MGLSIGPCEQKQTNYPLQHSLPDFERIETSPAGLLRALAFAFFVNLDQGINGLN